MSDDRKSVEPEAPADTAAIDAEFEPAAEPAAPPPQKPDRRPNWSGVAAASIAAALAGGAIGTISSGSDGKYASASEVAVDIERLRSSETELASRIDRLRGDVSEIQTRISTELQRLDTLTTERDLELQSLTDEITALNSAFSNVMGLPVPSEESTEDTDATTSVPNEGEGEEAPETSPSSGEPVTLLGLNERLNALESLETGDDAPANAQSLQRAVTSLRQRMRTVESRNQSVLEALEQRALSLDDVSSRLTAVEQRLETGTFEMGEGVDAAALVELRSEVDAIRSVLDGQRASGTPDTPTSALSATPEAVADAGLAILAIESAARRGRPFPDPYERLRTALPSDPSVLALEDVANLGAPTLSDLRGEFENLEDEALRSDPAGQADDGWGWMRRALEGVVVVRRSNDGEGASTADLLATARLALGNGDLESAIQAVETLDGPAADLTADWLAKAKRRHAIETGLTALRLRLIGLEQ